MYFRLHLRGQLIYPIADIFRSLQGEGHFVGYPMAFVRLAGCSVQDCHIRAECDEAPWKMRERLAVEAILSRVRGSAIVCVTGGEPTDHDLVPLVSALIGAGHRVHLETSGARSVLGMPFEWITVSPKTTGYKQRTGHTLKIVVRPDWSDEEAWGFVEACDRDSNFFHRYLQPLSMDVRGPSVKLNNEQVTRMLLSERNLAGRWALSMQAHRVWGLP